MFDQPIFDAEDWRLSDFEANCAPKPATWD